MTRGPTVNDFLDEPGVPSADSAHAPRPFVHRTWPSVVVGFGLGLTAVWMLLLGYGAIVLINELMDVAF